MNTRLPVLLLSALLALLSAAAFAGGPKLYKWTDEHGVVHYGSSIPPQYAKQQREVLNAQGQVVKTLPAQKTPEQIAKDQQEKAAAAQKAKQTADAAAAQREHDQVLLDTYVSVDDMKRDRDGRLGAVNTQINVTNASISGLQASLADYQSQADSYNKRHQPVPAALQQKLDDTLDQLTTNQKLLLNQQQKQQAIHARFQADIARFKELKAQQAAQQQNSGG